MLEWPTSGKLILSAPNPSQNTVVTMLGMHRAFKWGIYPLEYRNDATKPDHTYEQIYKDGAYNMYIDIPAIAISELPSLWAWVFRLSDVS